MNVLYTGFVPLISFSERAANPVVRVDDLGDQSAETLALLYYLRSAGVQTLFKGFFITGNVLLVDIKSHPVDAVQAGLTKVYP